MIKSGFGVVTCQVIVACVIGSYAVELLQNEYTN